jgi:D-alanine-D-alanine ligase
MTAPRTVLLLAGGDSAERDVSLSSSRGIAVALRESGHRVLVVDPARPNIAPTEDDDAVLGDTRIGTEPPRLGGDVHAARAAFVKLLTQRGALKVDVVFNGLHGGVGEDGTVQAVLEYLGIPFTGTGAAGSALAMDKHRSKTVAAAAGVPVPPGLHLERSALAAGTLEQQVRETVGAPCVVKPNAQGSSVGLSIVKTFAELDAAARRAFDVGDTILVERYIEGREITQAVLEGGPELPVLEIRPRSGLYDYVHKYQSGSTEYLVPAPISPEAAHAVSDAASRAFASLGLSVYARMDFRLDNEDHPFMLEANTLPGMTSASLVPKSAAAVGMSYVELCDFVVRTSLARFART